MDVESRKSIAELGPCREDADPIRNTPSSQERPDFSFKLSFVSTAYAQSEVQTTQDTKVLIEQFDSSASYLRREARSQLAKMGIPVVHPLLARLSEEPLSYRSRLGVLVALTEMMRENKRFRVEIVNIITDEDLGRLVDAAADEDRTIRIYASEFLYDLGDPRTISMSLDRFPSASANGRYNLLLVIKGAVPFAPEEQRTKVIEDVNALKAEDTPKTNDLIKSIADLARGG